MNENNINIYFQMTSAASLGTIAYIIDEQAVLVRINTGWQYVAVSF